jgi:hypothetical protein
MTELVTLFQIAVAAAVVAVPMIVLVRLIAGDAASDLVAPARGIQEGEPVRFLTVVPFARATVH